MNNKYGKRERYDAAQKLINDGLWTVDLATGNIFGMIRGKPPLGTNRDGYRRVAVVCEDGKYHYISAHRVVWESVYGPSDLDLTINHKDGNGLNNCIDNLELKTNSDNCLHAHRSLNRGNGSRNVGEDNPQAKLTAEQVSRIKAALEKDILGRRIAEFFDVGDVTISNIKHGVIWSYVEPNYSWDVSVIPNETLIGGASGSSHNKAKLTETDIPTIRQRYEDGEKPSQIAKDYPVSAATISNIVAGRTWKRV